MIKVGLIGYGKAGQAVAEVLKEDPRFELVWVAKRNPWPEDQPLPLGLPVFAMSQGDFGEWLDAHPVDALVDFSDADTIHLYGEEVRKRHLTLVSAISAYSDESLAYARSLGEQARVLCSPNITLGINFLILSARMLRGIAPFADVEILEQHFREKPEMSVPRARSPRRWTWTTTASPRCAWAALSGSMRSFSGFRTRRCASPTSPSAARRSARARPLRWGNSASSPMVSTRLTTCS